MSDEKIGASVPTVDYHFPLADNNYGQPYIKSLSTALLSLKATTFRQKKGIKLGQGESFCYTVGKEAKEGKNNHIMYLYEAGVHPKYAESIQNIHIYVTRKNEDTVLDRILVGTLTAVCPRVPVELTLGENCVLSHDSRRDVFFNGFSFDLSKSPELVADRKNKAKMLLNRVVWSQTLDTMKELWVAEICPSQVLEFDPIAEGKEYHLLKVYSKKDTNESIRLHSCCNERIELLGDLINGCNPKRFNIVFDGRFTLSHTSHTNTVIFSGYTMPGQPFNFKLKDLSEYAGDRPEHNLKSSPKISVDSEYQAYQAILAKSPVATSKKQPVATSKEEVNLAAMSPVTAPLISLSGLPLVAKRSSDMD